LDWQGKTADEIFDEVDKNKHSGAIVLMHDGYPQTLQALKRLLPALKKDGYQAVSLSQMAKLHSRLLLLKLVLRLERSRARPIRHIGVQATK
jgi:peptidoglycan/xylan/chitin deacetylase (PgdA/CDA1 family)